MMRYSLIASCVVACLMPALPAPAFAAHHGYRHVAHYQSAHRQFAYRHAMAMPADDTRHYYYDYAPAMAARQNEQPAWQSSWQSGGWSQNAWEQPSRRTWRQRDGWTQPGFSQNNFGQSTFGQNNFGRQQSFGGGFGQTGQYGELSGMAASQASANGIPASLVERVIKRESGGNPRAVSAGNYGLMQIRLGTARSMGFSGSAAELLDPQVNMTYAVRYLAGAYRAAGGNESRAVALYASGYHAQARAQGFSPYASPSSGFGAYAQTGFNNTEPYGATAPVYRVRHRRYHA